MEVEDGIAIDPAGPAGQAGQRALERLVEAMRDIIERLEAREAGREAAVILSGEAGVWIAGADIEEFTGRSNAPPTASA
jgi:enoyl-CoA hydratase/carnithine racemase